MMTEKMVFMVTHGPEDPERATLPLSMAVGAQALGVKALLGFQVEGVLLLKKGVAEEVSSPGFPPLKELLDLYIEAGGKLYACGPCVNLRRITPEDFIPGVLVVNAPTFIKEITEATNVMVY